MIISLINRSKELGDAEVQTAIRAVNRQIAEDFEPYWSFGAKLRLEGAVGKRVNRHDLTDMRGDAILYLVDEADESAAFGRRNDFLGTRNDGKSLESFGLNPGGYVIYFDPSDGKWHSPTLPGDKIAQKRPAAKKAARVGRGYRRQHTRAANGANHV